MVITQELEVLRQTFQAIFGETSKILASNVHFVGKPHSCVRYEENTPQLAAI